VIGFTARQRELTQSHYNVRKIAELVQSISSRNKIALVFGNEKNGLANKELKHCNLLGFIDANKKYSSLNLAQAVQIVCHEIRMLTILNIKNEKTYKNKLFVSHKIQNGFYLHLEELLSQIGFLKKIQSQRLMQRLRLLFNRIEMEKEEVNILRGILTKIQKKIK
jgi:TrmH family RNA methyltransferase